MKIFLFIKILFISIFKSVWAVIEWDIWTCKISKIVYNCENEVLIRVSVKRKYHFNISVFNHDSIGKIKNKKDAEKWVLKNLYNPIKIEGRIDD